MPDVRLDATLTGPCPMTKTTPSEPFLRDRLNTPIGALLLVTDADGVLRGLDFEDHESRLNGLLRLQYGAVGTKSGRAPKAMRSALSAYFDGEFAALETVAWR